MRSVVLACCVLVLPLSACSGEDEPMLIGTSGLPVACEQLRGEGKSSVSGEDDSRPSPATTTTELTCAEHLIRVDEELARLLADVEFEVGLDSFENSAGRSTYEAALTLDDPLDGQVVLPGRASRTTAVVRGVRDIHVSVRVRDEPGVDGGDPGVLEVLLDLREDGALLSFDRMLEPVDYPAACEPLDVLRAKNEDLPPTVESELVSAVSSGGASRDVDLPPEYRQCLDAQLRAQLGPVLGTTEFDVVRTFADDVPGVGITSVEVSARLRQPFTGRVDLPLRRFDSVERFDVSEMRRFDARVFLFAGGPPASFSFDPSEGGYVANRQLLTLAEVAATPASQD